MADIDRRQVERYYRELKGYLEALPDPHGYNAPIDIVRRINIICDELVEPTRNKYPQYTIGEDRNSYNGYGYDGDLVKMKLSGFVAQLNAEFDFDAASQSNDRAAIVINNQNTNTIDIDINFTIDNLIDNAQSEEEKNNLGVIGKELKSPSADWEKIKTPLSWIINYSKDLSIKVIPIILDYYLKKG